MMKSSRIWAGVASNGQSAEKRMVCMMEILPELLANWVDASVSNLRKQKSPEKKRLHLETLLY